MSPALDHEYLTWLYARIGPVKERAPSKTYWSLFRKLYSTEFIWLIPNDDNRVEDGRELRQEFLYETRHAAFDRDWMDLPCSVLELIFGLSKRLAFEAEGTPRRWFWELIQNLDLERFTDRNYDEQSVDEIVNTLIWRTYSPTGRGGLFPLRHNTTDQREVEIWYQMAAYILERT